MLTPAVLRTSLWRSAEYPLDFVGGGGVGCPVGDVELDRVRGSLPFAEVLHGCVEMILADVGEHDLAAGLGEHLRLPEARARAARLSRTGLCP